MKNKNDDKKFGKLEALQFLMAFSDFSGEVQGFREKLMEPLISPPSHEVIIEAAKPQKSEAEILLEKIKKGKETESQLQKAYEFHNKDKKLKTNGMNNKDDMLSQFKKNSSDISYKSELLKKKSDDTKKGDTGDKKKEFLNAKKELTEKKVETKPLDPKRKELLDKHVINKEDILGSKGPEKKGPDKIKTEHKPDKPKPK